jgi:hypothetical protein
LAHNAGHEGSVVLQEVTRGKNPNRGFNAATGDYEDLVKAGIIDAAKVTRMALQNAASVAGLLLTTDAMVSEIPAEEKAPELTASKPSGIDKDRIAHSRSQFRIPPGTTSFKNWNFSKAFNANLTQFTRGADLEGNLPTIEVVKKETTQTSAEAYAVARIRDQDEDEPFLLRKSYVLEAGLQTQIPEGFKGAPVQLPPDEEEIEIDIVVYAEDMEIAPDLKQSYVFNRKQDSPLREFRLTPTEPGHKIIRVEFRYHGYWLTTIRFEVDVAKQESASPSLSMQEQPV